MTDKKVSLAPRLRNVSFCKSSRCFWQTTVNEELKVKSTKLSVQKQKKKRKKTQPAGQQPLHNKNAALWSLHSKLSWRPAWCSSCSRLSVAFSGELMIFSLPPSPPPLSRSVTFRCAPFLAEVLKKGALSELIRSPKLRLSLYVASHDKHFKRWQPVSHHPGFDHRRTSAFSVDG